MINKSKPIVYLLNSFPNISETFITDEILALIDQGVPICIFSLNKPETTVMHENARKILAKNIVNYLENPGRLKIIKNIIWLALFKPQKIITFIRLGLPRWMKLEALGYVDKILKCEPVHIHCHYAAQSAQVALVINLINETPFSITTHGYDVFFDPPDNYQLLANSASSIFTISEFNKKYLIDKHYLPEKKIITHYCGVDIMAFSGFKLRSIDCNQPIIILTVARLHPIKGHGLLLKAIHKLNSTNNYKFTLWFVGDGPLKSDLEAQAKFLDLGNAVKFFGYKTQAEIAQLLRDCHLFVLPSLSEGIPISLMEAMAGFTPVIGPNVNGVPELISDKIEGYLFTPGDVDSLCAAIVTSISQKNFHQLMTQKAYIKVARKFSLKENALDKYKDMTKSVYRDCTSHFIQ